MTLQTAGSINQNDEVRRGHYIPLGKRDLVAAMISRGSLRGSQRKAFEEFALALESRFHQEFYETLRDLGESYAPFDPDCIIVDLESEGEATKEEKKETFFRHLHWLLEKANYRELSRQDIEDALGAAKMFGIRLAIDFDAFSHLSVYVRSEKADQWVIRKWYRLFKPESVTVPVYRRLILIFQYSADSEHPDAANEEIFLKIFKNIPKTDIDILLPSSRVRLSLLDRGKIIIPTVTGIGLTTFKMVKAILAWTLFTGVAGAIAFIALIVGTIGYGVKSFFGYLRTKDKYQLSLTRHLYYQNLGNNKGVLFRMLNDAEEQEFREALIAYYLLWHEAGGKSWTKEKIDRRAEEWLFETAEIRVDFEDDDALGKLERLGLAVRGEQGWKALPLSAACERLSERPHRHDNVHQPTLTEKSAKTTSRTSSD